MKSKHIQVSDTRSITIYDEIFTANDIFKFYDAAQRSHYSLDRGSTGLIEHRSLLSLKSDQNIFTALNFGLLTAPEFKPFRQIIKDKKLRILRSYINLCTTEDSFPYHTDSYSDDNLTMLYYLNSEWNPLWEGETIFAADDLYDIVHAAAFKPGRLAVFSQTIPHKSTQPSTHSNQYRFTLAVKLLAPSAANYDKCWSLEDMVIPEDADITITDTDKNALEFLKPIACKVNHSASDGFNHLFSTFKILKSAGLDDTVCLAGLFHCVYGTGSYNELEKLNIDRDVVRAVIGDEAEQLVIDYKKNFPRIPKLLQRGKIDDELRLKLLWISYANAIEQLYRNPSFERDVILHRAAIDEILNTR